MIPLRRRETTGTGDGRRDEGVGRRRFLALGASTGALLLAGCTGDGSQSSPGTDGPDGGQDGDGAGNSSTAEESASTASTDTGTFRLLISDQPVAIDEFDSLEVSFDRARIFRSERGGDDKSATATEGTATNDMATPNETATATATPTPTGTATGSAALQENATTTAEATSTTDADDGSSDATDEAEDSEETGDEAVGEDEGNAEREDDGEAGGFSIVDLGGATVDLTEVVGDRAIGVFEDQLTAGRYTKIELYAADVGGIVDGTSVDVKIPSGKLQIVKPFEVEAGGSVSFVFDITVVKKGNKAAYNLLPVISESGVAGEDVDVEEVGDGGENDGNEEGDDAEDGNEEDGGNGKGGNGEDSDDGSDDGDSSEDDDGSDGSTTTETASNA